MIRLAIILAALLALVACASVKPDGSNGIRRGIDLPGVTLEQAYHRADNFARGCHSGGVLQHATVTGSIYPDTRTAQVNVAWGGGNMPEQIQLATTDTGASATVVATGHGMWDQAELDAAAESLRTGTVRCR